MKVTKQSDCCRGFQRRRVQTGRTIPPEPTDESVRYIPLTKGKFAIVDAEDYERVAKHKWCVSGSGNHLYACRNDGHTVILLHRVLMNAPAGMVVDHIDGNRMNNRRNNLRVCTHRQNLHNSLPHGRTSRFKGVWWDKRRRLWDTRVRCNGVTTHIGLFRDEVEAARAYDRKAYELFGEYAYLNFPHEIRGADSDTFVSRVSNRPRSREEP